jgi:hypothetical protein
MQRIKGVTSIEPRGRWARATAPWALVLLLALSPLALGAELTPTEGYTLIRMLMSEKKKERREAADQLIAAGDRSLIPGLVDAFFYTPRLNRPEMSKVLEALTGEKHRSYYGWVESVGRSKIEPKERYLEWKLLLLETKDPAYARVFYPGAPGKIRLEEIISGGVPLDGIPSLDNPPVLSAARAKYLRKDERVFGVEINGESRAYPYRFLSWHEMLNDVLGGEPITLSFCTLCGSGILYSGRTAEGGSRTFGTSGLLYRSNKLMYDRDSYTLWSNITGEAVFGRLAGGSERLEPLAMTVTTWKEWLSGHPNTTVLDLEGIRKAMADRSFRFPYQPGAADTARQGVEFPVWQQSDRMERNAEIFALRINGAPKAYPVDRVAARGVVNDVLGGVALVLVSDAESGAIRAFDRGEHSFKRGSTADELRDEVGGVWAVSEEALVPVAGGEPLLRLTTGHIAYWFGWYGYYPQTEVWDGSQG